MNDEEDRGTGGLVRFVGDEIVSRSTSLVRRGLDLLEPRKPNEDGTVSDDAQAAEKGDATAQYRLGMDYEFGIDVPQDAAQAAHWYRNAAEQGNADAQYSLGAMYFNYSDWGVPRDETQAIQWFRKAAEQGQADAQNSLGTAYFVGRSVPQDRVEAHKWWSLAASFATGDDQKEHAARRDSVAKFMTLEECAEAQRRAKEWIEAFERWKPQELLRRDGLRSNKASS